MRPRYLPGGRPAGEVFRTPPKPLRPARRAAPVRGVGRWLERRWLELLRVVGVV